MHSATCSDPCIPAAAQQASTEGMWAFKLPGCCSSECVSYVLTVLQIGTICDLLPSMPPNPGTLSVEFNWKYTMTVRFKLWWSTSVFFFFSFLAWDFSYWPVCNFKAQFSIASCLALSFTPLQYDRSYSFWKWRCFGCFTQFCAIAKGSEEQLWMMSLAW